MSQGVATAGSGEPRRVFRLDMLLPTYRDAFVYHSTDSLKDSMLMFPSCDGSAEVSIIGLRDLNVFQETRTLKGHLKTSDPQEVLAGFCRKIVLPYTATGSQLLTAYLIVRPLFRVDTGGNQFPRDLLPLGLLGLQERNWDLQNAELGPLRDDFCRRREAKTLTPALVAHPDPAKKQQYLCVGDRDEVIVVLDDLGSAGWKYRVHSFDVGLSRSNFSFQSFMQLDDSEVHQMALMAPLVYGILAECREHVKTRSDRSEESVLRETIRRADFYTNSVVKGDAITGTQPITDFTSGEQSSATQARAHGEDSSSPSHREISLTNDSTFRNSASENETEASTTTAHSRSEHPKMAKKKNKGSKKKKGKHNRQEADKETQDQTLSSTNNLSDLTTSQETTSSSSTSTVHDIHSIEDGQGQKQDVSALTDDLPDLTTCHQTTVSSAAASVGQEQVQDHDVLSLKDDLSDLTLPQDIPASSTATAQDTLPLADSSAGDTTITRIAQDSKPSAGLAYPHDHGNEEAQEPNTTQWEFEMDKDISDLVTEASQDSDKTIKPSLHTTNIISDSGGSPQTDNAPNPEDLDESLNKDTKGKGKAVDAAIEADSQETPDTPRPHDIDTIKPSKFDSFDHRLCCHKAGCRRMTSCWDSQVVICPACGTDSYVRYCSKEHLYEDIQRHWLEDCRKHAITGPIDRNTIRRGQHLKRPYIFGHGHNLVERHRQAVYRALEDADFFVFDNAGVFEGGSEPTQEGWSIRHGTGKCILSLVFPDDGSLHSRRLQFDHRVELCLMFGAPLCYASCMAALSLVREALVLSATWTEEVLDCLCLQLAGEWGGFRVPEAFYNVNDVNVLWHAYRIPPSL